MTCIRYMFRSLKYRSLRIQQVWWRTLRQAVVKQIGPMPSNGVQLRSVGGIVKYVLLCYKHEVDVLPIRQRGSCAHASDVIE